MSEPSDKPETAVRKAINTVVSDVVPQSAPHGVRLAAGLSITAAVVVKFMIHQGAWERNDFLLTLAFLIGGLGVLFTKSIVVLINAVTPWKDKSDAP